MTLQEHMDTLGIQAGMLAHLAGHGQSLVIGKELVDRALEGLPIAHSKAQALSHASHQYGLHGSGPGSAKLTTLAPEDIEGLFTYTPGNINPVKH